MKLLTIVGARPQFIKAAIVSRALAEFNATHGSPMQEVLVHTGQHFDANMSERFFIDLGLPSPTYQLGIAGLGHGAMTGRMLEAIDEVLDREHPDAVLVYGDTNSTVAGALAAAKRHVPVAHVEAGVRSYNRRMPEEINRVVTDHVSRWLFCPTLASIENLEREGIVQSSTIDVSMVGDVMFDVWLTYEAATRPTPGVTELIESLLPHYYVATVHREENTTGPEGHHRLEEIIASLDEIADSTPVVMPVHPRIRSAIVDLSPKHIRTVDPVGYFDMIALLSRCMGVFTDSGGLQKEAYFAGKPCITLRTETEWIELVRSGCSVLAGSDRGRIIAAERRVRDGEIAVRKEHLYGAGDAARRIVRVLADTA
jgi:UDP-GlcNAc3NAcA epimerase